MERSSRVGGGCCYALRRIYFTDIGDELGAPHEVINRGHSASFLQRDTAASSLLILFFLIQFHREGEQREREREKGRIVSE